MRPISEVVNSILLGDCLDVLKTIESDSVDAIATDGPYALGTKEPTGEEIDAYLNGAELDTRGDFMGREWSLPSVAIWKEALRVLKPGGYCGSFCGTRTFDLMDAGMRAAGFTDEGVFTEKFGCTYMSWVHSQGMPKSYNVSKGIDKYFKAERKIVGTRRGKGGQNLNTLSRPDGCDSSEAKGCGAYGVGAVQTDIDIPISVPSTEDAKRWSGYGTALKPAWEPILIFKKPGKPLVYPDINAPFIYSGKTTKRESSLDGRIENDHPTRKPLKLLKRLIPIITPPGGIVLDMFVGSGTTTQAAAELGYKWIGIERDPHFHELSTKRMGIVMADLADKAGPVDVMDLMGMLDG